MEKTAEKLEEHGYKVVGFLVRKQSKRRRKAGRARGFYEGIYVYLRVREPGGKKRDIYLGTPGVARAPGRPKGGGDTTATEPEIATSSVPVPRGRTGVETRELSDTCPRCSREYGEHDGTKCPPPRESPRSNPMPWEASFNRRKRS